MPTELLLIIAAFVLALRRQPSVPPVSTPPALGNNRTEDLRFQVSYQQQFLSVQASQTSTLDAKYAVLLTLVALLFQYVDNPIENQIAHWVIFAAYFAVATILLALLAMQHVEVWTEYDPLLEKPVTALDDATLEQSHQLLGKMMVDNERRLQTKEYWMGWVLAIGIVATLVGLIFDNRQPATPTPVMIVTPTPSPTASPSPTPSPSPARTAAPSSPNATSKASAASYGVPPPSAGPQTQRGSKQQVEHRPSPVVSSTRRGTEK